MRKKLGLAVIILSILFCFNVLADDESWYDPLKNIISQTEYELVVNPNYIRNNGVIRNLHKKVGVRLNYRFSGTNFVLTGGGVEPYLQTAIYDSSSKKVVDCTKTKTYYVSVRYIVWENSRSKFFGGVGLAQERFRWNGGFKYGRYYHEKPIIKKNQLMPFVTISSEIKISRNTALSVEVWRYFGRSEFPFKDFSGKGYAFKHEKTQMMFYFIVRFS